MTINGNIKFFSENLLNDSCTYTFTSASATFSSFLYDRNTSSKVTSTTSSDTVNEEFTVDFNSSKTFNRIYIDAHNIKSGSIKYYDGSNFVDFSPAVTFSGNTSTTNYFEFASVTSQIIKVTATSTIVANSKKQIGELKVFSELGTVVKNPSSYDQTFISKQSTLETSTGGFKRIIFGRKYNATLSFRDANSTDISLFKNLDTLGAPFHVWPCGGIGQNEEGFKLSDIFLVNISSEFAPKLKSDLFGLGMQIELTFAEV